MKYTLKEIVQVLQKEIDYHNSVYKGKNEPTQEFKNGFVAGLRQAVYLIEKILEI